MDRNQIPPTSLVLRAYANGYFPMGGNDDGELHWHNPDIRAVLPIRGLHISRKLRRLALSDPYDIRIDTTFDHVVSGCTEGRADQWITPEIQIMFRSLHRAGYAHSVECWRDETLIGGIYGLALGQAFCAESMFSRESNASKIALIHLCARLNQGGFTLLDCQILNDHTQRLGAIEVSGAEYRTLLHLAIGKPGDFLLEGYDEKDLIRDYLSPSRSGGAG